MTIDGEKAYKVTNESGRHIGWATKELIQLIAALRADRNTA